MGRLVQPTRSVTLESGPGVRAEAAYPRGDEFETRVAKYIPAEVVGGYVSLDGIHPSAEGQRVIAETAAHALDQRYGFGIMASLVASR